MKKILYIFATICFFSFSSQAANSIKYNDLMGKKIIKMTKQKKTVFESICGNTTVVIGGWSYNIMTFCHDDGTTSTYITTKPVGQL
jgi:hypothetical protein